MISKDYLQLIGLEVCQAEEMLKSISDNFKFIYYRDKKQNKFDKEIVTAVKVIDGQLILVVSPMLFNIEQ